MRRSLVFILALGVMATPARGQTLHEDLLSLFRFGQCDEPLCLNVGGEHGQHYIPSVTQGEDDMLAFMTTAIGLSLVNLPFTAATSGVEFSFSGGAPVATVVSPGPIFAERAQTLGAGRLLLSANLNAIGFDNVRGVPLDQLRFLFAHENVGGSALGDPLFENDMIEVDLDLSMSLLVTTLFASYGLTDQIDVAVGVPLVRASLSGDSHAVVNQFTDPSPHEFETPTGPSAVADASASSSAIGLGDIAGRIKVNVHQGQQLGVALMGDVRLPTGSEEDFLGTGAMVIRGMGVVSGRMGDLAPHLNAGILITDAEKIQNRFLATLGFDHLMSDVATLAVDLVGSFEMGESLIAPPDPVVFTAPTIRTVDLTAIPDKSDHFLDAAFGFKLTTRTGWRFVVSSLFPLLEGGVRPRSMWTLGVERVY